MVSIQGGRLGEVTIPGPSSLTHYIFLIITLDIVGRFNLPYPHWGFQCGYGKFIYVKKRFFFMFFRGVNHPRASSGALKSAWAEMVCEASFAVLDRQSDMIKI